MGKGKEKAANSLAIHLDRVREDLMELGKIGRSEVDRGIYRMAFSAGDMEGRKWLRRRIEEAGLVMRQDGAANISALLPWQADEKPRVLIGSHIDTVPCAGSLDGSLGVIVGLECLRVLRENEMHTRLPIELIAFSDEEGRFGGMLGSQALAGQITPETLHARDLDGISLYEAMKSQGYTPEAALDARRRPEDIAAYLELHIEQGPVLERSGKVVGIVDEITGLFKWVVSLRGEANHAGTTPMEMRNDAFMGLADFAHEIPRVLDEIGTARSRATVGKAQILPGSANTVPGHVEFSLDVRDTDSGVLDELHNAFRKTLSAVARRRKLMFEFEQLSRIEPVHCSPRIVSLIEAQVQDLGCSYLRMPSGAAHDAQIVGSIAPVGMIFVPSRGGVSHSPAEWTDMAAIEAGAQLVLKTLLSLSNDE